MKAVSEKDLELFLAPLIKYIVERGGVVDFDIFCNEMMRLLPWRDMECCRDCEYKQKAT